MRLLGLLAVLLTGCTTQTVKLDAVPSSHSAPVLNSTPHRLQALLPQAPVGEVLRVYLEGDGHAWATPSSPSLDPTPHSPLVVQLALQDTRPAAYVARPCQFVSEPSCHPRLWTRERFAQPALASLLSALDQLKALTGAQQLELIGYSGGATMALLAAAQRDDVLAVQTLAGNLDPSAWTTLLRLSPLEGLTPLDYRQRLTQIPQRHLIGRQDRVLPPELAHGYATKLAGRCVQVIEVDATHQQGWPQAWVAWQQQPVLCPSASAARALCAERDTRRGCSPSTPELSAEAAKDARVLSTDDSLRAKHSTLCMSVAECSPVITRD